MTTAQISERQDYAIQQNITTLRNRVNELGVSEPIVQRQGLDRINVQLPGVQNSAEVKDLLGRVATLEFRLVDMQDSPYEAMQTGRAPLGTKLYKHDALGRRFCSSAKSSPPAMSSPMPPPTTRRRVRRSTIKLDARGGEAMLRTTRANSASDGGGVHREAAARPGRRSTVKKVTRDVDRRGRHQRRHHPRRVRQQLPDHRAAGRRGARSVAAAAFRARWRPRRRGRGARDGPEPGA